MDNGSAARAERDQRILELRAFGWTQRAIANEVGCAQPTVGLVLNPELAARRAECGRLQKARKRREAGIPERRRIEKRIGGRAVKPPNPSELCSKGLHLRTPENCSRRGDCKVCARERAEARARAAGVKPQRLGANWTCGHDPATSTRYVKGKAKDCKICHREREAGRPYNAERVSAYAKANRDKINARYRIWKAVNRRGAEVQKGGREAVEYAQIIKGDPCAYCGAPGGEIDHIIAVTKGGGSDLMNLAPACRSCNARKGTKELLQFMLWRQQRAA